MSRACAGHYLDHRIAKILHNLYPALFAFEIDADNPEDIKKAFYLKKFIRDNIKPDLFPGKKFCVTSDNYLFNHDIDIDPALVLDHERFRKYMDFNTRDILKHFFSLFTYFDNKRHDPGEYPVDAIFFAGRGIQLAGLQENVIAEVKSWSAKPDKVVIFAPTKTDLKAMPAKGAIQYAIYTQDQKDRIKFVSHDILARYGILYKNPQKKDLWDFHELLNPHSDPKPGRPAVAGNRYEAHGSLNLGAGNVAYIVESFSAHTAKDMNAGDTAHLNQMIPFDTGSVGPRSQVDVEMAMDCGGTLGRGRINVRIGTVSHKIPRPLKFKNDTILRQSLWPYTFDNLKHLAAKR